MSCLVCTYYTDYTHLLDDGHELGLVLLLAAHERLEVGDELLVRVRVGVRVRVRVRVRDRVRVRARVGVRVRVRVRGRGRGRVRVGARGSLGRVRVWRRAP